MNNAEKRIKFIEIVKSDTNTLCVGDVAEIFSGTLNMLMEKTETFKKAKEKLGEEDYTKLLHSLCNSFLCSLYCSASKNEEEAKERMSLCANTNSDLLAGIAIAKEVDA